MNGKRSSPKPHIKGIISKIYKELEKLDTKIPNNAIKRWGTELNREFSTQESQIAERHLKKCSMNYVKCKSKQL